MTTFLQALVLSLGLALCLPSGARHFRWASQGDAASLDPHAQNEGVTNQINNMVYERLLDFDKKMKLVPMLATSWENPEPNRWVFKLRQGVKFHDGTPFTADDVVFSFDRAKYTTASFKLYALESGTARKVDDYTVEFVTTAPNPVEPGMVSNIFIMSKAWCEKNKSLRPQDITNREETFAALNSNGTGPFILVAREPGVKTTHKRNPDWWGKKLGMFESNVDTVEYRPVANGATRNAALRSGELDFVLDPPVQDIASLKEDRAIKVWEGQETRVIFVGLDQGRDELLYSTVRGKNPFKDVRVRRALYQAVDIDLIKNRLMSGKAYPTGAVMPSPLGTQMAPEAEKRMPFDVAAAKKLMAEAGYPQGFEITLDCPNNRYINDERLCSALAAMWSKIDVKVRLNTMPRSTYFPKIEKLDTSMYLLGWGGSITDPETIFTPVWRNRGPQGVGYFNYGNYKDDALDAILAASSHEADTAKRNELIRQAYARQADQVHYIPLHRQVIPWAARTGVTVVHRPDNWLEVRWITMK